MSSPFPIYCSSLYKNKYKQQMSNQQPQQVSQSSKPITGAFDLETKIRVIIQQVLTATMRKLSQFNEKVEGFEKFFFTYTQRMKDMEDKGKMNEESINRMLQTIIKNKELAQAEQLQSNQKHEKLKLEKQAAVQQIKEIEKKLTLISRQYQSMGNEFSNTRKRFLQFSDQMTNMKQQVSWKITKYVQETAEVNTKIRITHEQIKKQYFNINLSLQKSKQKYEEIISNRNEQDALNQQFKESLLSLQNAMNNKGTVINSMNKKMDEMETALYSKIKLTQSKLERKIQQLIENSKQLQKSLHKVDSFTKNMEEVKDDTEKMRRQLLKKFEQSDQKHGQRLEKQILNINTSMLNYQKGIDKKMKTISESQQKNVQFFNKKLEFLKVEVQTQISSKATKMLQEKSKTQSGVANSAIQLVNDRISKLTLQTKKEINSLQTQMKDMKAQVNVQVRKVSQIVQEKLKAIEQTANTGLNPDLLEMVNQKLDKVAKQSSQKLKFFEKQMQRQTESVKQVVDMKNSTQKILNELLTENQIKFNNLQEKLTSKVEKVLYTVTKLRGDAIIRNQFLDKQIKQLKKVNDRFYKQIDIIIRLFPAVGQCINLILCLIFDAEYQHSKIAQENLPDPSSIIRFQNMVEGVLYEYIQKKKSGTIHYRHKQQKKVDIVKATLHGYTQIWEQVFQGSFKYRQEFIPKNFFKKYVQKNIGSQRTGNSPNKDQHQSQPLHGQIDGHQDIRTHHLKTNGNENSSSEIMNKSFHIKKKKVSTIRSKDDFIMVLQQDLKKRQH